MESERENAIEKKEGTRKRVCERGRANDERERARGYV